MRTLYQQAHYLTSVLDLRELPPDRGAEVAFAGRSNAGKSSVLNALTGRRGLAYVSKTPGRTQTINFFALDEDRRLVDLPGYGYAKAPKPLQARWQQALEGYMGQRSCLKGVVVIVDARRPLTEHDRQMLTWCDHLGLPAHVLITKADKLKRAAAQRSLELVREALGDYETPMSAQLFSATQPRGIEEAQAVLDGWLGVDADQHEGGNSLS